MNVLVFAPHPDDEVLGVGGTLHRLVSEGHKVTVAIVTRGWEPRFSEASVAAVRAEAEAACATLGVHSLRFMDLPVTRLHELPRHELNATFDRLVAEEQPQWVFLPAPGDRHVDHRETFDAANVALRPDGSRPCAKRVWCYETISGTHWSAPYIEPDFQPQVWVDISAHLEVKLQAARCYASQLRSAPSARSHAALQALAVWRGSVVARPAAEAFVVLREII